jgi:Na+/H+ antiporter NhaD/arsenite permease-like protein
VSELQNSSSAAGVAAPAAVATAPVGVAAAVTIQRPIARRLDIFALLQKIEWDTLLFFDGVLLGVGGLGALG